MKRIIIGIVSGVVLLAALTTNTTDPQLLETDPSVFNAVNSETTNAPNSVPEAKPVCDGLTVASDCEVDGVTYSKYLYHPAVPEKTRTETTTTYKDEISSYCTLCR